jgi:hypothetical protein
MILEKTNKLNISFGYGKGLRRLVSEEYPYCAYTGVKYGSTKGSRATVDHISPQHYGGLNKDKNYLVVTQEINCKKGCTKLKKFLERNNQFLANIVAYFEALLRSDNAKIQKYANEALSTVLSEIGGLSPELQKLKK